MPSTYSPDLRIELIANGDKTGTWGTITNDNLGVIIEDAISGLASVSVTTANQALTALNGAADQARCAAVSLTTTTTANFAVYVPPVTKLYVFINASAYTATVYCSTVIGNTTAAGTGVAIPAGKRVLLRADGVNVVDQLNHVVNNMSFGGDVSVGGILSATSPAFSGTPTAPTAANGTNTTQIATTAYVLSNGAPIGGLMMWPTASAPVGWLLCDGQAVSRTTYAALFALIGTTFGAGDTTTTFNVPDYRDRMPIGAHTITAIAGTGGSKDAVVVSHTHTASVTDPGHSHQAWNISSLSGAGYGYQSTTTGSFTWPNGASSYLTTTAVTNTTGISVSNSTTGVSGTNANLPPYLGINFIIKA